MQLDRVNTTSISFSMREEHGTSWTSIYFVDSEPIDMFHNGTSDSFTCDCDISHATHRVDIRDINFKTAVAPKEAILANKDAFRRDAKEYNEPKIKILNVFRIMKKNGTRNSDP